jgi:hypothetical protein
MTNNFLMHSIRLAALAAATLLPGMACSYSTSSPTVGAAGGNTAVAIYTQPGCSWQVSSGAAWLQIYSARSGVGNGTVYVYVSPNRGGARTATINGLVYSGCSGLGGRSCGPGQEFVAFRSTVTEF